MREARRPREGLGMKFEATFGFAPTLECLSVRSDTAGCEIVRRILLELRQEADQAQSAFAGHKALYGGDDLSSWPLDKLKERQALWEELRANAVSAQTALAVALQSAKDFGYSS